MAEMAPSMEREFVHNVYEQIAEHFDKTRFSLWPCVVRFLNSLGAGSVVLDVGCGNGKYFQVRKDCTMFGCEPCRALCEIAQSRGGAMVMGNGLQLPYKSGAFDAIICVAVLHHVDSKEKRQQFLDELERVLVPGGKALVTVWAICAALPAWKHLGGNDFLVPWQNRKNGKTVAVYDRFYHLFSKDELCKYSSTLEYEAENWVFTLQKPYTCPHEQYYNIAY